MAQALAGYPQVEVQFLFSGREDSRYFDMAVFGDYWVRRGLTFVTRDGKVNVWQTVLNNDLLQLRRDVKALDLTGFDLVISDFEPVSAHAARQQNVPSLSISHQAAFIYDVPKQGQRLMDAFILRYFAPTQLSVGLHWYHFNQPVLPPIIDVKAPRISRNGEYLVYLPFEALDNVVATLRHFPQRFVCFHPECQAPYPVGNILLRPLSKVAFHEALMACEGVIANGGFELPSEALALGKKLLLKPLSGQFEQQSNVATLDLLGLASTMECLDVGAIRDWLEHGEGYKVQYPDVAQALAAWITEGDFDTFSALQEVLWSQVSFPEHVNDLLTDTLPVKGRKRALLSMRLPALHNKKVKVH